jgi:hypothetical protein
MTDTERAWSARVREWRASGQSAPEYAQGLGFASSTLRWWASRLDRASQAGRATVRMARLVPVSRSAEAMLTVRVGPAHVEVRGGFDRELLREVVEALGGSR